MPRRMILACLLLTAFSVALFAAGEAEQTTTAADEKITISVMQSVNNNYPFQEDWLIYREMEERANVELDLQLVPDSDFTTKKRLVVASGDLPDMVQRISTNNTAEYVQWAAEGAFLPLSDYADQLPHFQQMIEEWSFQPEMEQLTMNDGKYYILPQMFETPWQKIGFLMRGDILEKHGLETPRTLDELYDTLVAVKDNEPDMIPFSCTFQQNLIFMMFGTLFDTQAGWGGGPMKYVPAADRFEPTMISEDFRAMLAYAKKLWDAGLIDRELFVADNSQINNKIRTGKVFMTIHWSPALLKINTDLQGNTGNDSAEFIPVLPFKGGTGKAAVPTPLRHRWGTVMPRDLADDSRLSRILEFADWSGYSEEGMLINLFGVEGETYEMVDGKPKYLDKFYVGDLPDLQQMKKDFGIDTNGWNQLYPLHFLTISLSDVQKEYYDQLKANDMYAEPNPIVVFTPSQKEDAKLIETPLQDYRNEMILKFVMGDASLEDDWDGYVERCEEKGVDELTVLYNEAWSSQN